mmetsp:Transcript_48167/g.114755  ORF Transcript_48167/g.114755 Transcript_48167/m.114755 type:complete len:243 (+) Transcript_48167:1049-1777(+)
MWSDRLHVVVMVVAAQDDVHLGDLMRKEFVVGHTHVRQGDDNLRALLLLQLLGQASGAGNEVLVVHLAGIDGGQGDQPLLLHQADEAHLATVKVHDARDDAVGQRAARLLVRDVADQPGEVVLRGQLFQLVHPKVEVVIPVARRVDAYGIQRLNHVLAVGRSRHQRRVEGITAEEYHRLVLAACHGFRLELPYARHEACDAAHRLLDSTLHVVDVVEVQDGHLLGLLSTAGLGGPAPAAAAT